MPFNLNGHPTQKPLKKVNKLNKQDEWDVGKNVSGRMYKQGKNQETYISIPK